jgi:uncharacterized membrane protein YphA (DoxX/SURF4 family)
MSLSRAVARPMLASMFLYGGLDSVRHPDAKVAKAASVTAPVVDAIPFLPKDPVTLVRLNGAVQVGAGGLLALGRMPRLAALALATTLLPTTLAGHPFWDFDDPQERATQRIQFLKNLSMLGGLLLSAADTGGRPSVTWWARSKARRARRRTTEAAAHAQATAERTMASIADALGDLPVVGH